MNKNELLEDLRAVLAKHNAVLTVEAYVSGCTEIRILLNLYNEEHGVEIDLVPDASFDELEITAQDLEELKDE